MGSGQTTREHHCSVQTRQAAESRSTTRTTSRNCGERLQEPDLRAPFAHPSLGGLPST
ncbi:hypothetical protein F443_22952 [Phytophthora nicotianae P1569]|uniref:Uncharacterized protein n=1 Tax=Phytophthora nicotianae P1569 TaxID=1317065 RepID=V9DTH9_PHYNI|nr:hypothetical protein F443_22952 [Phytophthora nicotianae P1569]